MGLELFLKSARLSAPRRTAMPSIEALYDEAYDFLCDGETDQAIATYKAILED